MAAVESIQPFYFFTERRLVQLTGVKARTIRQLLIHLKKVPGSSIFYHTHQSLLEHHFEQPLVHNDFAVWVTHALQEDALGEKLGFLDLREFTTVRQLREAIVSVIESELSALGDMRLRHCPPGEDFYFRQSKSFIMPSGLVAHSVAEFFDRMPSVSTASLYFHLIESRLRLGLQTNDFSSWLEGIGEPALARAINALDPYAHTLDELKMQILRLGGKD